MGKSYRQGRLGEEIKRIISEMLLRELKDPRLDHIISITSVDVTSDGSYATVYLTVFEKMTDEQQADQMKDDVIEGMLSAKGIIKREIGKQVKLRHMPELIFKMDNSLEYGEHMDELISKVVKK